MQYLNVVCSKKPFRSPGKSGTARILGITMLCLLFLCPAGVSAQRGASVDDNEDGLHTYLRELERRVEEGREEYEERFRDFRQDFEEEQRRFWEENEEYRREGQKALESFSKDIHRFLEERGIDLQRRLEEMEKLVQKQGEAWFNQLREWEEHNAEEQEDPPEEARERRPVVLRFYILAQGIPGTTDRPIPPRLDHIPAEIGVEAASLVLLDEVYVRTGDGSHFESRGHIADSPSGHPQPYVLHAQEVNRTEAGAVRLDGLNFEVQVMLYEGPPRTAELSVSTDLPPRQAAVLGTASLRGAGQSVILVGATESARE